VGVWATGSFESDTALDWLEKVGENGDFSHIRAALSADVTSDDMCIGRRAIAAADLVACWLGNPPPEPMRRGLVAWTREHSSAFASDLPQLARRVVALIKKESGIRKAWTDHSGVVDPKWLDSINDLEHRLEGPHEA
jgi:hypothetical protein